LDDPKSESEKKGAREYITKQIIVLVQMVLLGKKKERKKWGEQLNCRLDGVQRTSEQITTTTTTEKQRRSMEMMKLT
jgi:hypothetical protein